MWDNAPQQAWASCVSVDYGIDGAISAQVLNDFLVPARYSCRELDGIVDAKIYERCHGENNEI